MANIKSAKKRARQAIKRRAHNVALRSQVRSAVRKVMKAIESGNKEAAKANVELVAKLRGLLREFTDVRFVKVAAHSGIPLNERVDELARGAISRSR